MRTRHRVLSDQPLCQQCLDRGQVVVATEVHHKVRVSDGGTDDEENLVGLCHDCHEAITTGRPAVGTDGWPLP